MTFDKARCKEMQEANKGVQKKGLIKQYKNNTENKHVYHNKVYK